MRRGAQGHVAAPRGPVRVPAWHNDDVYILYSIYYGYHTYKHSIEEFKLTFTSAPLFKLAILFDFFGVGLSSLRFLVCRTRGATRGIRSKSR